MQIRTRLREVRKARGLGAAEMAHHAGISRQTIYAIEDGSFVPNTAIALRLARALDVTVEELFSIAGDETIEPIRVELLADHSEGTEEPLVRLCRVNDRIIAIPVSFLPRYLPAADGVIESRSGRTVSVKPSFDAQENGRRLLLAGCDPALSLLNELSSPSGIEIVSVPCASRRALEWLKQGRVHAAGSHIRDRVSGDYNLPVIRRLFSDGSVRVVTFAVWEQGLVLRRGNPKGIRSIADLGGKHVKLINREKGSGSRDLLDGDLRKAGIRAERVEGYSSIAHGHLEAAYAVASGAADCCIATRCAARCFGLHFIPLAVERFDLSFSQAALALPATQVLLDLLNRSVLRRKLEAVAGYDTAETGRVLV